MKKLVTLLAAAGMVVAASAPANAVDIKVDARYRTSFATGEYGFMGGNKEDIRHRMRLGLTMAASENLSAYVMFQINQGNQWGNVNKHGLGAANEISARQMYLDWTVPGTAVKVRSGRHHIGLPAEAFGSNSILGADMGAREGVVVTAPVTDNFGLTGIWTRMGTDAGTDLDKNNTDDMFALAANLKFDGFSGAVYAAYATIDGDATDKTWNEGRPEGTGDAYWVGFTSTFSFFDPFTLKLSAAFGEYDAENAAQSERGWNIQAKASYKTAFGTPVLGGWYFSGNDKDGKGYMPNAGYFAGTNHYYDGFGSLNSFHGNVNNAGTWAVQAGIEGVSFLSDLKHDFHVTYMEGTNHTASGSCVKDTKGVLSYQNYLTEDDALVEISLVNSYKIYKNLTAKLELAYLINDLDSKTAQAAGMSEDDWYAGLTFDFRF